MKNKDNNFFHPGVRFPTLREGVPPEGSVVADSPEAPDLFMLFLQHLKVVV